MSVKFRTVYACEFYFVTNDDTTGTAHTGTVYHDRVHGNDSRNIIFLSGQAAEFHHDHRSDSYTFCISFSFGDQIIDYFCYHTTSSVRSVICCNIQVACYSFHLFFQNDQVFGLCTNDNIGINTMFMQPFYLWVNRRSTNSTCYKQDFFLFQFFWIFVHEFGRTSQRSYKIFK